MSQVRDLHRKAMSLLDEANIARESGDIVLAGNIRHQAYQSEQQAALLLMERQDVEPTRSMLFKGAAIIAVDCGLVCEAENLIDQALAGDPPAWVAEELRDLHRKITENQQTSNEPLQQEKIVL